MRFGIDVPNYGKFGDPQLLADLACESEAAGWDGFFVWDHLHGGGQSLVTDPWIALAAIAVRTEHIRFGPMVTPLPRRRPSKLARETVALDHLSGGRLILGVGIGSQSDREFGGFGDERDPRVRGELLDEGLAVLMGLWTGEEFSYEGSHHRVDPITFKPPPLQQPRIPIWVAGKWPNRKPIRRAVAWDGVFPIASGAGLNSMMSPEAMGEVIAYVRSQRTSDGPFDFVHGGVMTGDLDTNTAVARDYADVGVTWWLEHVYVSGASIPKLRSLIRRGPPSLD